MSYDYKKSLKKLGISGVIIILAGLASVYGDSQYYLALVPLFEGVKNYIKHKDD